MIKEHRVANSRRGHVLNPLDATLKSFVDVEDVRAPQPTSQPDSPTSVGANAASTVDATLLQSLRPPSGATVLRIIWSEIASMRRELRNSLLIHFSVREVMMRELEQAATVYVFLLRMLWSVSCHLFLFR